MIALERNQKNLKDWCRFYRRIGDLGINGLSQKDFLNELDQMLSPNYFEFSYKQNKENVIIGKKVLVADVRQNPYVKRYFRPNDLKEILKANDMEYIIYQYLGNPFYKRHLQEQNPKRAKREYQAHILTNENARKDFEELFRQFRFQKKICLICYCQHNNCHRKWLIELLKIRKKIEIKKKKRS